MHEHQDEDGRVEVELGGGELREVTAEESSSSTGEGSGNHEGDHAVLGDGDAYGLGCNLVIAHGHNGTAGTAANQVEHDHECNHNQDGTGEEGRVRRHARGALGALDDSGAVLEQVQVVDRGVARDVKDHVQAAESTPTMRQVTISLIISPKAKVTMAR